MCFTMYDFFLLLDSDLFSLFNVSPLFISIFDHLTDRYLLPVLTLLVYYPGLYIDVSIEINLPCNKKNIKLWFKLLLTINTCLMIEYNTTVWWNFSLIFCQPTIN